MNDNIFKYNDRKRAEHDEIFNVFCEVYDPNLKHAQDFVSIFEHNNNYFIQSTYIMFIRHSSWQFNDFMILKIGMARVVMTMFLKYITYDMFKFEQFERNRIR